MDIVYSEPVFTLVVNRDLSRSSLNKMTVKHWKAQFMIVVKDHRK